MRFSPYKQKSKEYDLSNKFWLRNDATMYFSSVKIPQYKLQKFWFIEWYYFNYNYPVYNLWMYRCLLGWELCKLPSFRFRFWPLPRYLCRFVQWEWRLLELEMVSPSLFRKFPLIILFWGSNLQTHCLWYQWHLSSFYASLWMAIWAGSSTVVNWNKINFSLERNQILKRHSSDTSN